MREFNPLSPLAGITNGKSKAPPRLLIYGTEGIGKSSLAAEAGAVFLPTEDGLGEIDCQKFPLAENYEQVVQAIDSLIKEEHDFTLLCIDSADWLERLVQDRVCRDSGVVSIELANGGYGKGYGAAMAYWRELLAGLDILRTQKQMAIIFIAHAQIEKFEDPDNPTYDKYSPRLHKKTVGPLVAEWCDAVLFATRKMRTSTEKLSGDKKRTTAAPIGKDGGDRVLRCIGSPTCTAKNRYSMPEEIPMVQGQAWAELAKYL